MTQIYEMMYILRPNLLEEQISENVTKYRNLLKEQGATNLQIKFWGRRRLAYPIAKHQEGIYILMYYQAEGQQVAVIERSMRLSEDVIRYLTIKPTEAPEFTEETFPDFSKSNLKPKHVEEQPTQPAPEVVADIADIADVADVAENVSVEVEEQPTQPAPEIVEA
jgi:small subunit ribosomal protein S6